MPVEIEITGRNAEALRALRDTDDVLEDLGRTSVRQSREMTRGGEQVARSFRDQERALRDLENAHDRLRAAGERAHAVFKKEGESSEAYTRALRDQERATKSVELAQERLLGTMNRIQGAQVKQAAQGFGTGFLQSANLPFGLDRFAGGSASVAAGGVAALAASAAISELQQQAAQAVDDYKELARAERGLRESARRYGVVASSTAGAIDLLASQGSTRAGATTAEGAAVRLAGYVGRPGESDRLLRAVADLAAATGQKSEAIPTVVGQIQRGEDEAFARLGLPKPENIYKAAGAVSDLEKARARYNAVLSGAASVEGAAARAAEDGAAKLEILSARATDARASLVEMVVEARSAKDILGGLTEGVNLLADALNGKLAKGPGNDLANRALGGLFGLPQNGTNWAGYAAQGAARGVRRTLIGGDDQLYEFAKLVIAQGLQLPQPIIASQLLDTSRALRGLPDWRTEASDAYQKALDISNRQFSRFTGQPVLTDEQEERIRRGNIQIDRSQGDLAASRARLAYFSRNEFDNPLQTIRDKYQAERQALASASNIDPLSRAQLQGISEQREAVELQRKYVELQIQSRNELETLQARFASARGNPFLQIATNAEQAARQARAAFGDMANGIIREIGRVAQLNIAQGLATSAGTVASIDERLYELREADKARAYLPITSAIGQYGQKSTTLEVNDPNARAKYVQDRGAYGQLVDSYTVVRNKAVEAAQRRAERAFLDASALEATIGAGLSTSLFSDDKERAAIAKQIGTAYAAQALSGVNVAYLDSSHRQRYEQVLLQAKQDEIQRAVEAVALLKKIAENTAPAKGKTDIVITAKNEASQRMDVKQAARDGRADRRRLPTSVTIDTDGTAVLTDEMAVNQLY